VLSTINEEDLCGLIDDVRHERLSRRAFTSVMIAVGLTAPLASQMLAYSDVAIAAEEPVYSPTRRGGGGPLKLLWWQAPTLLNPHFAVGGKDYAASRIFYEPLAGWDADGNLRLVLAAEVPTLENGGLGEDGKSVTWKLKPGVRWHDGKPFTADDCVFTWDYAKDPAIRWPAWYDLTEAPVRAVQGGQIARGADQLVASGHRPVSVRGIQAGRSAAGEAQPGLPCGEPTAL
jgi:peptide/nickel transport system substrate-binding protein